MLTVAYLANRFPAAVEPYVTEEIEELRSRGIQVIAGTVLRARKDDGYLTMRCVPEVALQPLQGIVLLHALWLCVRHWKRISRLVGRVLFRGSEDPLRRAKTLIHTWLGACYAVRLRNRGIEHIHVHHGYFGSWIAMVAARLLNVGFSMTLHGSDLLLRGDYLDTKLENCRFCLTISEFNRRYILEHYPGTKPEKVLVARLGVGIPEKSQLPNLGTQPCTPASRSEFTILTVGRLHLVKDHAFLVRACAQLRAQGIHFDCSIAGEGPERHKLESLIRHYGLEGSVTLLGHVAREQIDSLYDRADVVVLTSRSEGIPLVLMEAMARGKVVLAPAITGIPELVIPGKYGFLYQPGSLEDLVAQLLFIRSLTIRSLTRTHGVAEHQPNILSEGKQLDWVRHGAKVQVRHNFNRRKNLESFGDLFIQRTTPPPGSIHHEDSVLQQI